MGNTSPAKVLEAEDRDATRMTAQDERRPSVFLDSSALAAFLDKRGAAAHLFDPDIVARVRFVTNPVALQEILLLIHKQQQTRLRDLIKNKIELTSIDQIKTDKIFSNISKFRNNITHSNDLLILADALDCDYFITSDHKLLEISMIEKPKIMTAEEFIGRMST